MDWLIAILNVIILIALYFVRQVVKKSLPTYMEEKAKNLATKQDIEEITRKTEEVQKEFREDFERFSTDVQFKYEYHHKQFEELYSKLYEIIAQSEYTRRFIYLTGGKECTFEDCPFLEISPTKRVTQKMDFKEGESPVFQQNTEIIDTPISRFNKKQLSGYIIDNGQFASQQLLKIAVSYRIVYEYYSGNPAVKSSPISDVANDEELRLLRDMICCIVKEYNQLRKELRMDYDEDELKSGIPHIYDKYRQPDHDAE